MALATFLLAGCGSDEGPSASGEQGASATGAAGSSSAATGGGASCSRGLVDCGEGCADIFDDPNNCGGCGVACAATEICHARSCQQLSGTCGEPSSGAIVCGGKCVTLSADHCDACGAACTDGEICVESDGCLPAGGTGAACDTPIALPSEDNQSIQYWFGDGTMEIPCGASGPAPSVVFSWVSPKDKSDFEVELYGGPSDALRIAVYQGSGCAGAPLACATEGDGGEQLVRARATFPVVTGEAYRIVVAAPGTAVPEGRFELHFDD